MADKYRKALEKERRALDREIRNIEKGDRKETCCPDKCPKRKPEVKCDAQDQLDYCVPLSFDQELVAGGTGPTGTTGTTGTTGSTGTTGTFLQPLSNTTGNTGGVHGVLRLRFRNDLSSVKYALYVYNATSPQDRVTMAHLHLGFANVNGPIIVTLFMSSGRNVDGLLSHGRIENGDITLTSSTNSIASLFQLVKERQLYCNVHTVTFPGGFIRGQIF